MKALLGIDLGTTHTKVGLFVAGASAPRVSIRPAPMRRAEGRPTTYDPDELWATVRAAIVDVVQASSAEVVAIGIAGMAETGLLVDRQTGETRTPLIPWFERCATTQAQHIRHNSDALERFRRTGLRVNYKAGLAKLLWLRDQGTALAGGVWLSAPDYIAYRLTGEFGTDPTLAVRTHGYDLVEATWDAAWLADWDLDPGLFPQVVPSGTPVGGVRKGVANLPAGTPVAVAGHDHICAAFAAGITDPGTVFDSIGTAETLVGAMTARPLTEADFATGLIYAPHVVPDRYVWMSSLSSSGGSIEWLRELLGEQRVSYEEIRRLLATADRGPTGILYFPYLSGSGAPHPEPQARAAFLGLSGEHTRADLVQAVLEGVAYEIEATRRAAQATAGHPITRLMAAGGGTQLHHWMQIRADVLGCTIDVLPIAEATLWGAALLAGRYATKAAPVLSPAPAKEHYTPDPMVHQRYRHLYEEAYAQLQPIILAYSVERHDT